MIPFQIIKHRENQEMKRRLLSGVVLSIFFAGCASTQPTMSVNHLETKIAHIEQKTDEQNQEISSLRIEIENLTSELASFKSQQTIPTPIKKSAKKKDDRIIRVSVSPQKVQSALKKAGYYDGAIDGKIGNNSQKAIKSFQRDHDLEADGLVGQKTWLEMKKYLN